MRGSVFLVNFILIFLLSTPAFAALNTYGYLIGTFVQGSNRVEPISQQGNFLHYEFKVNANNTEYKVVIDIKHGHVKPFPYRIFELRSYNSSLYHGVFSASNGYHAITTNGNGTSPSGVGLDFIRHEGIIRDSIGNPWKTTIAQPTSNPDIYTLPEFDALFNGVSKIYVFGQPFTSGNGMHNVHQNQGNYNNNFMSKDGIFQDGAVIFEYSNGTRKMLMVKFGDAEFDTYIDHGQLDFSATTDIDGVGPERIGNGFEFPLYYNHKYNSTSTPNGIVLGPFYAEQIVVTTGTNPNNANCSDNSDLDIFMHHTPNVSTSVYEKRSRFSGCKMEYIRSYSPNRTNLSGIEKYTYYLYIKHYNTTADNIDVVVQAK